VEAEHPLDVGRGHVEALAWNQIIQLHLQDRQAERVWHEGNLTRRRRVDLRQIKRHSGMHAWSSGEAAPQQSLSHGLFRLHTDSASLAVIPAEARTVYGTI